jgi:hypothetical protein
VRLERNNGQGYLRFKFFNMVNDHYPIEKNFQGHLFWDTIRIQNLIWSICIGLMVAKWLIFDNWEEIRYNKNEHFCTSSIFA